MENSLELISKLDPKIYEFRVEDFHQINLSKGLHYGFIAQDIQETIPSLIKNNIHPNIENNGETGLDYLGVNYLELIPILVKAVQEQQQIIDHQNSLIATQNEKIAEIEKMKKEVTEIKEILLYKD